MLAAWKIPPIKVAFPFFAKYELDKKTEAVITTGVIWIELEADKTYTVYHTKYPDASFSALATDRGVDHRDWGNEIKYIGGITLPEAEEEATAVAATPMSAEIEQAQLFLKQRKERSGW